MNPQVYFCVFAFQILMRKERIDEWRLTSSDFVPFYFGQVSTIIFQMNEMNDAIHLLEFPQTPFELDKWNADYIPQSIINASLNHTSQDW